MSRGLRQAWILVALAFLQFVLTVAFQTVVPWGYLMFEARSNSAVADGLKQLEELGRKQPALDLDEEQMRERKALLAPMFETIPWVALAFLASVVIYPVLGYFAGRYCERPESAGLLIMLSVLAGHNPATSPAGLEYVGLGDIGIGYFPMVAILLFQFVTLVGGITLAGRTQTQSEGEETS